MTIRRPHGTWTFLLAVAILALTAMAGPELVRHIGGSPDEVHTCPLYNWTKGIRVGAPSSCALPAPPLAVETLPSEAQALAPSRSPHASSSRAPPAPA